VLSCFGLLASAGIGGVLVRAVHADDDGKSVSATLPELRPNQDWQVTDVPEVQGLQARAWSDAAAGCHLALFSLPVPDTSASENILESLSATMAKSDYELTSSGGELDPPRFGLAGFGVTGIVSLLLSGEQARKASVLACYWNAREPSYCRSLCVRADDKFRALLSAPAAEKQP
jgi:hypothetical protein